MEKRFFKMQHYRELEEETSIKNVELIKEIDGTITYELPDTFIRYNLER